MLLRPDERLNDIEEKRLPDSQRHSILEHLLRQEKIPTNSKLEDLEFKMASQVVIGDELFDEDLNFDNESEWSIDIK